MGYAALPRCARLLSSDCLSRPDYHAAKSAYKTAGAIMAGYDKAELERGFLTSGLWGYSRHPNFAAEQSIWFFLYQWGCFATKNLYSWSGVGALSLVLLFQGSTWLTELITSGKYPEYREYQRQVGMFVPTSLWTYEAPAPAAPKVIRTSELEKILNQRQKGNQK